MLFYIYLNSYNFKLKKLQTANTQCFFNCNQMYTCILQFVLIPYYIIFIILLQVIKASLADVSPAVNGIESTKWSDIACAAFLNFSKIDYTDDNLIAFIHKVVGDTHKIVLYNHSSRAEFCLNSKLVSQGYATTMDPGACVFKKTNTRKLVKKLVLQNSRNVSVIS